MKIPITAESLLRPSLINRESSSGNHRGKPLLKIEIGSGKILLDRCREFLTAADYDYFGGSPGGGMTSVKGAGKNER